MRVKFRLLPTLAYLCLLPVLVSLGVWQLNRAVEKRALFKLQEQRLQSAPMTLNVGVKLEVADQKYRSVFAKGHYDNAHQFLLDNQIHAGRAGYFVLTPFILAEANQAVLVNRGWIPASGNRQQLPDVTVDAAPTTVIGRINSFPSIGLKLVGADVPSAHWPAVVGVVDEVILAHALGYPLMPFQVELDKQAANGYLRDWQQTTLMRPEQHTAYAVQWFALALLLSVLFFRFSLRKNP